MNGCHKNDKKSAVYEFPPALHVVGPILNIIYSPNLTLATYSMQQQFIVFPGKVIGIAMA